MGEKERRERMMKKGRERENECVRYVKGRRDGRWRKEKGEDEGNKIK